MTLPSAENSILEKSRVALVQRLVRGVLNILT